MDKIILASQSPRRRELLTQIGLDYQVIPSTVEEVITETDPKLVVQELSRQKAEDVAGSVLRDRIMREQWEKDTVEAENGREGILVIGADTVVSYQGQILGKPVDTDDAVRMLSMLQGNAHSVFTGVTLIRRGLKETWQVTFAEETRVHMYPMTEAEIRWYVGTGEPMDKAGAYGIQGLCARFVEKIEGDYNNVVGLPVGKIWQELKKRSRSSEKEGRADGTERIRA